MKTWTVDEIRALGVTTDLTTAGSIFGIGRTKAHELHRAGQFPVPVLELGPQTYRVPVAPILERLGATSNYAPADGRTLDMDDAAAPTAAALVTITDDGRPPRHATQGYRATG